MKHALSLGVIIGLLWIVVIQGHTIVQQTNLIQQMIKNPQCLIPEEGK